MFLAGDAAHINNPLGGMGLNGGLHDAISLSGRIAAVAMHGRAGEDVLDGYEAQRKPEAVNAINAITERNKKLMEERDPGGAGAQSRGLAGARRRPRALLPLPARHVDDFLPPPVGDARVSGTAP